MTPRAGIGRALLIAGFAFAGLAWITWFADGLSGRISTATVEASPRAVVESPSSAGPHGAEPQLPLRSVERALKRSAPVSTEIAESSATGIELFIVDSARHPIAGAVVQDPDTKAWSMSESDVDGVVFFEFDERRPERLTARAPGFRRTTVAVPAEALEPLLVVLNPLNRLRVHIVTDSPDWTEQLEVALKSEGQLFEQANPSSSPQSPGLRSYVPLPTGSRALLEVEREGVIDITALAVGVEIDLFVRDRYGYELHSERLPDRTATSYQEIFVVLPEVPHEWSGKVVDQAGSPVEGASVDLSWGAGQGRASGLTDANGLFRLVGLWADRGDVIVTPNALSIGERPVVATKWSRAPFGGQLLPDVDLTRPQTFVLDDGRSFTVLIRDRAGVAVIGAGVQVLDEERSPLIEASGRGEFEVSQASVSDCIVRVTVGGRDYEQTIAAHETELVVTTPVHGEVMVHIDGASDRDLWGYCVLLEPLTTDLPTHRLSIVRLDSKLRTPGYPILPGNYRARIVNRTEGGDDEAELETFSDAVPVQVAAGEDVQVRLAYRGH